jgi:beta-lactam-binding protein with PASTA domain
MKIYLLIVVVVSSLFVSGCAITDPGDGSGGMITTQEIKAGNYIGMTLWHAKMELERDGFPMEQIVVRYEFSSLPEGTVIYQSQPANSSLLYNLPMELSISKGIHSSGD